MLMAEQNFTQAIRIADRGYVIVHGKIAVEGRSADELNNNELIKKFYLGTMSGMGPKPRAPQLDSLGGLEQPGRERQALCAAAKGEHPCEPIRRKPSPTP